MINDVKNLKESGTASIAELRDFLKSLKARNPQEVIGIVSTSLLVQSLAISCVATAVLMAGFTIGPYLLYGPGKGDKPAAAATAAAASPAPAVSTAGSKPADAAANPAVPAAATTPDAEKAAKALGLDETRPADPKKNPLDKPDLDKLLDGL